MPAPCQVSQPRGAYTLQSRPIAFLDFTRLTLEEFRQFLPSFDVVFHARMAVWRMDGKPRTARRFPVDKNSLLPTPDDRLFFLLVYLKTSVSFRSASLTSRCGLQSLSQREAVP